MPHRSAIGVVIARAGSRGLPNKNVLPIAGRPCVEWTLDDAQCAQRLDAICVSSDDQGVLATAHRRGLVAIDRPSELAQDDTRVDDALRHAVDCAHGALGRSFDLITLLYANVPIRPDDLIDRALELCAHTGCDSVQSFTSVGKHHPWWTARLDESTGRLNPWEGDTLFHGTYRRQDLPPAYIPCGGVCVVKREALFGATTASPPHAFLGVDRRGVATPEGSVVDIDSRTDMLVADAILRERTTAEAGAA